MATAASFMFVDHADAATRLARVRKLAWLLDAAMRLPGTKFRFGLNGAIGLTPVAGDALMALVSLYFVYEGHRLGLPPLKLARMLGNIAVEATVGSIPVVGDLIDMGFKANLRNLAIIERHLGNPR